METELQAIDLAVIAKERAFTTFIVLHAMGQYRLHKEELLYDGIVSFLARKTILRNTQDLNDWRAIKREIRCGSAPGKTAKST